MKKKKVIPLSKLYKKLWDLQSKVIRQEADGVCYICGDKRDWKLQQAGHYCHCSKMNPLSYDLRNIKCSCVRCNKWLSGNLGQYATKLIKEYGEGITEELESLKRGLRKLDRGWVE